MIRNFVNQLWSHSEPQFNQILKGAFVTQMIAGTLTKARFNQFLYNDIVYLKEYAEILGHIAKRTQATHSTYYDILQDFVQSAVNERKAQAKFMSNSAPLEEALPVLNNYVKHLSDSADHPHIAVALAATFACPYAYPRIMGTIYTAAASSTRGAAGEPHPHLEWLAGQKDEQSIAPKIAKIINELAAGSEDRVRQQMIAAFSASMKHEKLFYNAHAHADATEIIDSHCAAPYSSSTSAMPIPQDPSSNILAGSVLAQLSIYTTRPRKEGATKPTAGTAASASDSRALPTTASLAKI